MKRRLLPIIAALGAVALAAGCSSSGSSGSSASDAAAAAKAPIKLMVDTVMTPSPAFGGLSFPYDAIAAKAAAQAINAKGGIDGHPIQIDACDNKGDPNQSAACGREAKANGDIAVVGSWDILGAPLILPVLQAEGIPYIGATAGSVQELSNPDSFQFDAGAVLGDYGLSVMFANEGCKNVAEFVPANTPGSAAILAAQQHIAAEKGYQLHTINIAVGQADVSAQISTALSLHPDCASYEADGQTTAKLIAGLRQAGFKGKFLTAIGSLLPPFLQSLGKTGNGVLALSAQLAPTSDDPMVTEFRDQVIAYTGSAQAAGPVLGPFGQDGWSSVQLIKQALTGTGSYTSAELLKKLPTMCDFTVGNVHPNLSFCKPAVQSKTYTRLYDPYIAYFVAENGTYTLTDGTWHNIAAAIPAN